MTYRLLKKSSLLNQKITNQLSEEGEFAIPSCVKHPAYECAVSFWIDPFNKTKFSPQDSASKTAWVRM